MLVVGCQLSVVGCWLSVVRGWLSVVSCSWSVVSCWLFVVSKKSSFLLLCVPVLLTVAKLNTVISQVFFPSVSALW
ncbi:MAG: hypothetical protein ACKPE8_05050 [Dolichospermum sp.]